MTKRRDFVEQVIEGHLQARKILIPRQSVVAVLDEKYSDIFRQYFFRDPAGRHPRHRIIAHAVKQSHRTVKRDWPPQ